MQVRVDIAHFGHKSVSIMAVGM